MSVSILILVFLSVYISKFFYFPSEKLSIKSDILVSSGIVRRAVPASEESKYEKITESDLEFKEEKSPAFYKGSFVQLITGRFVSTDLKNNILLIRTLDNQKKMFLLSKDTTVVCQPTGELNVTVNGQSLPAKEVFIENKMDGSYGLPWGIEIKREEINARVTPDSQLQVYFTTMYSAILNRAEVKYLWFQNCR